MVQDRRRESSEHPTLSRRAALRMGAFGGLAVASGGLMFAPSGATPETWRSYPSSLYDFKFPEIEGLTSNGTDTWYVAGFLTGQNSGREYAFINIFCKSRPAGEIVTADFMTLALYDLGSGAYGTYTLGDFPPANVISPRKLEYTTGYLGLSADTPGARSTWVTRRTPSGDLDPFRYHVDLRGTDQNGLPMRIDLDVDPQNPPAAAGGDTTRGITTMFGQPGTSTYFQTGTKLSGTLTWGDETEPVSGSHGHIDRQLFPAYAGVHAGLLARDHSHEWRSIHLDDGTDLSIWRQFNRTERNALTQFAGVTRYIPNENRTTYAPEIEVTNTSYVKWPMSMSTMMPPPSPNRWVASEHTLRAPGMGLELRCTPLVQTPAHGLPVEYMIGPARWEGTLDGRPITGMGFSERTLVLYRNWELAGVLRISVANLPAAAFTEATPSPAELNAMVDEALAGVDRGDWIGVLALCRARLKAAVTTLNSPWRDQLTTLLSDLETAPS